jgi:hypothetical protein
MDEATFFLGIYDYTAKDKVSSLINAPPYTQMTFPYQNTGAANGLQVTQLEAFLRGTDLKTVQNEDLIDRYASFLLANNDQEAYLQFLQAFNQVNPRLGKHLLHERQLLRPIPMARNRSRCKTTVTP